MKKVVIFDFDGTLVDSKKAVLYVINELAKKHNRKLISIEEFEEMVNNLNLYVLWKYKIWPWQVPQLIREGRLLFRQKMSSLSFFPGIVDILRNLKINYIVGVLTHNRKENADEFFRKLNVIDVFSFIVETNSRAFGKEGSLREILYKYKMDKKNVVYIGDEVGDVRACKKVGIKSIAVTWGFSSRKSLINAKPSYLVDKVSDLRKTIDLALEQ